MNKLLKWDEYKRSMAAIKKAKKNEMVNKYFEAYKDIIFGICKDVELVNETYMRLTNEYDPNIEFMEQYMKLYRKLKYIKLLDQRNATKLWIPILENQINGDKDGMD